MPGRLLCFLSMLLKLTVSLIFLLWSGFVQVKSLTSSECVVMAPRSSARNQQRNSRTWPVQKAGRSLFVSSNPTVTIKIITVLSCLRQGLWGCICTMVIASLPGKVWVSLRAPSGSCRCTSPWEIILLNLMDRGLVWRTTCLLNNQVIRNKEIMRLKVLCKIVLPKITVANCGCYVLRGGVPVY